MSTMNISLPESLKSFVDAQVAHGNYGTSSEYVRELIRRDQGRMHLRSLLMAGVESDRSKEAFGRGYFEKLRARARKRR
jgi:antitoxin ParD1/3/4